MEQKVLDKSNTSNARMKAGLRDKIIEIHKKYGFYLTLEDYRVNLKLNKYFMNNLKKELPLPTAREYIKVLELKAMWFYFYKVDVNTLFKYHEELCIPIEAKTFARNYIDLLYEGLAQELADAINGEI